MSKFKYMCAGTVNYDIITRDGGAVNASGNSKKDLRKSMKHIEFLYNNEPVIWDKPFKYKVIKL